MLKYQKSILVRANINATDYGKCNLLNVCYDNCRLDWGESEITQLSLFVYVWIINKYFPLLAKGSPT